MPAETVARIDSILGRLPEVRREGAWVGERWRIGRETVAHVFGGEDQRFRIVFRASASEVMAFEHLGPSYFRVGWGRNVVGVILDEDTDWDDLQEMLLESYSVQAPARLAAQIEGGTGG